jgi:hypothetical protein
MTLKELIYAEINKIEEDNLINERDQYHPQALDLSDFYFLNKERHYERN